MKSKINTEENKNEYECNIKHEFKNNYGDRCIYIAKALKK